MSDRPGSAVTMNQACAPLFLYLTTFRRNAAFSTTSIQQLSSSLQREFDKLKTRCERDASLSKLHERVRYALVATADQVVLGSVWPQRAGWSMNLLETHYFGRAEGGKQFYRVVDEVLDDGSDDAAAVAEVLFSCMALGFQGELLGERSELERRRRQLFEKARLPGRMGPSLAPDAYGRNAQKDLTTLPTLGTIRMVGITVGALLFAFLAGRVATGALTGKDRAKIAEIVDKLEDAGRPDVARR